MITWLCPLRTTKEEAKLSGTIRPRATASSMGTQTKSVCLPCVVRWDTGRKIVIYVPFANNQGIGKGNATDASE